jgi:hypothetical protein
MQICARKVKTHPWDCIIEPRGGGLYRQEDVASCHVSSHLSIKLLPSLSRDNTEQSRTTKAVMSQKTRNSN